MKVDLQWAQRPHSLCRESVTLLQALRGYFFSPRSPCIWNSGRGPVVHHPPTNESGHSWHDVYCTSIWYWCILKCKQGTQMICSPRHQPEKVPRAICLSAAEEPEWRINATCSIFFPPSLSLLFSSVPSLSLSPLSSLFPSLTPFFSSLFPSHSLSPLSSVFPSLSLTSLSSLSLPSLSLHWWRETRG